MLLQLSIDAVLQLLLIVQPLTQMLMLGVQTKHYHADKISSAIPSKQTEAFYIGTVHAITVTSLNSPPLCHFMLYDLFLQFISLLHQAPGVLMTQSELLSEKTLHKKHN